MSTITPLPGGDDPWKAHLAAMTPEEKYELAMRIWEELPPVPMMRESPEWHRDVVESRVKMLEDGTAEVEDWEDVERELDELDS
jgi:hypothetical protein